jgi:hypothetical protein
MAALSLACLGEGGDLALSAGAPVTGVVEGTITNCGIPVSGAVVVLLVGQGGSGQARPRDSRSAAVTTGRHGEYLVGVAPPFAVPGAAAVRLLVTPPGGEQQELPGGTVELGLLLPPQDTLHLDGDLGEAARRCP